MSSRRGEVDQGNEGKAKWRSAGRGQYGGKMDKKVITPKQVTSERNIDALNSKADQVYPSQIKLTPGVAGSGRQAARCS